MWNRSTIWWIVQWNSRPWISLWKLEVSIRVWTYVTMMLALWSKVPDVPAATTPPPTHTHIKKQLYINISYFYNKYSGSWLNWTSFRTSFCVHNRHVIVLNSNKRFPTLGLYLKFGIYRILFYSGFGLDRFIQDSVLFRVWFRQISLYIYLL
jgi:hypothetical protein